jgi:hypothetical protein
MFTSFMFGARESIPDDRLKQPTLQLRKKGEADITKTGGGQFQVGRGKKKKKKKGTWSPDFSPARGSSPQRPGILHISGCEDCY